MHFGPTPLEEAEGAILAHSLRVGGITFKKGRRLSAADLELMASTGRRTVIAARLDGDELAEDEAATCIAARLTGPNITAGVSATGRVNLFASSTGLFQPDRTVIDAINQIDESITIATLPEFSPVVPGQMVATVKIIPFAVQRHALDQALAFADNAALAVHPYRPLTAYLVQTTLPSVKPSVLAKTREVTAARLAELGCRLIGERLCTHHENALANAIAGSPAADLLIVAGASAITDRRDVLPAGITAAGGVIEHFGMPVDPGNLLLLANRNGQPVVGLPGCARSPKLNGFDWVLRRIVAGITPGRSDIMAMGVGGLLAEIPTRPQPRAGTEPERTTKRVAALVLAAGRSSRMGGPNKLLATVGGKPLLRHTVESAIASKADPVIVVVGHDGNRLRAALAGLPVLIVDNPDYAEGLSSSLRAGISALPSDVQAALICLGDMPKIAPALLNRLIDCHAPLEGRGIIVPTSDGKRGNPVLWDNAFFGAMAALTGDSGARRLIDQHPEQLCEVPVGDPAVLYDVDTPDRLAQLQYDQNRKMPKP